MRKIIAILFSSFILTTISFSQDYIFTWIIKPSFYKSYKITVLHKDKLCEIIIKESLAKDSIVKKISKVHIDSLYNFLEKFSFITKNNGSTDSIVRLYFNTKILLDTNWIVLKNDTLRKESIKSMGYIFDKDSNKFYSESRQNIIWTDGNVYEGEYKTLNFTKRYSVYCAYISEIDYELNKFMYRLISRYDSKNDYKYLGKMIIEDKPKNEK